MEIERPPLGALKYRGVPEKEGSRIPFYEPLMGDYSIHFDCPSIKCSAGIAHDSAGPVSR